MDHNSSSGSDQITTCQAEQTRSADWTGSRLIKWIRPDHNSSSGSEQIRVDQNRSGLEKQIILDQSPINTMATGQLLFQSPNFDWHAEDQQLTFEEWKGQITLALRASSISPDIWFTTIIGYLGKEGFKR